MKIVYHMRDIRIKLLQSIIEPFRRLEECLNSECISDTMGAADGQLGNQRLQRRSYLVKGTYTYTNERATRPLQVEARYLEQSDR